MISDFAPSAMPKVARSPPDAPRTISFGADSASAEDLPPAVALALWSREWSARSRSTWPTWSSKCRTDLIRSRCEKPDAARRVLLKASELEKGMASGKTDRFPRDHLPAGAGDFSASRCAADDTPTGAAALRRRCWSNSASCKCAAIRSSSRPFRRWRRRSCRSRSKTTLGLGLPRPSRFEPVICRRCGSSRRPRRASPRPSRKRRCERSSHSPRRPTIAPAPLRASSPAPAKPPGVPPSPKKPGQRRRASLSKSHRTERACPHLREFQPQAGRPFQLARRRRRVFHSRSAPPVTNSAPKASRG